MIKTSPVFTNTSTEIKNCSLNLNEQSKNILFNTLIQQQQIQLNQQHLLQQQLLKQQLQQTQQNNSTKSFINQLNQTNQLNQFINCRIASTESTFKPMEIQQQLSPNNLKPIIVDSLIESPMQNSFLNTSNSSMDLSINLQSNQQCSPVTTSSCDNSLINSPVSTPTTMSQGSPMNCSSPVSNYSQSPVNNQSNNQLQPSNQIILNQSINQIINFNQQQQLKSVPKVNLVNKLNQKVILVDGQLPKNRKRKSTVKNQTSLKRVSNSQVKQISPPGYILAGLDRIRLNFDESSCSSNSLNSENGDLNEKLNQSNQPTKIADKRNQKKKQRAAANERERKRMSNINKAFEILKEKCGGTNYKLSKMEILKLAQNCINQLTLTLKNCD